MRSPGRLFTYLLVPLSLLGVILCVLAVRHHSWLAATTLAVSVLLSVARVACAIRAAAHEQAREDAEAAFWNGEEYGVGLAFSSVGTPLVFFVGATVVALPLALYVDVGTKAWSVFVASVIFALLMARRIRRNPGKMLEVTRRGVWDARFGWIPWRQVQDVSLLIPVAVHADNALRWTR